MTVAAAAATTLPSLWTGLLRHWASASSTKVKDQDLTSTKAEAVAHLKARIRQYEQSQPSYADDLRAALAQVDRKTGER